MLGQFRYVITKQFANGGVYYEYTDRAIDPMEGRAFIACRNQENGQGWFKWPCKSHDEAVSIRKMVAPHCVQTYVYTSGKRSVATIYCNGFAQWVDLMGLLTFMRKLQRNQEAEDLQYIDNMVGY